MPLTPVRTLIGFAALLAVAMAPATGWAQSKNLLDGLLGKDSGPGKAQFAASLLPETARPGDEVTLSITAELPQGYYIYSNHGNFDGRTKIETNLVGLEPLDDGFVPDHAPKVMFEPAFNEEIGKHFGRVTWSRRFRVKADAAKASVSGELTGQYCGGEGTKNAACIPIRPPFTFVAEVQLEGAAPSAAPVFSQHIRPLLSAKKKTPASLTFDFNLSPTDARPGDKVTLSIKATLDDGWHTFSLTQSGPGGAPTTIDVSRLVGLKPLGEDFVADKPFEVEEVAGLKLEVHNHDVTWSREYEVTSESYGLAGEIGYQTCRDGQCLPFKRVEFELGRLAEGVAVAVAGEPAAPVQAAAAVPAVAAKAVEPLLPFLVLCLAGGFFALLTPCSFPMVPITVSFFLHHSEAQHKRPWLLALVYCGTIVAAFTVLGVGIAAVFGAAKLTQLANISWLNYVIGAVFVLFALNMLGLFEIHMPGWLLTMTASKESTGSYLGAVFMALTFTLTSFTCTFAIAGGLLLAASRGEIWRPVVGMLAFGTAFAAPFFVLAMVPGLLKKLPKSGGWMNSVKVVMGLLELGAAVKFFSIADPAQVFFDHVTVMLIWFVLAVVTAIYLFGWFKLPHDLPSQQISPLRMLLGTAFFVLAGLLLTGIALPERGGVAVRQILAFAPARIEAGAGDLGPSLKHHGLEFALYLDKAVPVAQKQNRPLLIDFTGINCLNCRDMELKMGQPEWKERIAKFVGVQLFLDTAKIPGISERIEVDANVRLQEELVDNPAMPSYAVVSPDGKTVLAKYIGAETADQAGTFVKFLDEGWAKWNEFQAKKEAGAQVTDRRVPPGRQ